MFRKVSTEFRTALRPTIKDEEEEVKKQHNGTFVCGLYVPCVFERKPSTVTKSGTWLCRLFYVVDFVRIMPCTHKKEGDLKM